MTTFRWILVCLIILIASLILRVPFFDYVVYTLIGILIVSHTMGRFALDRVELERHCSRAKAEIGDNATVSVEVRNRKALPIQIGRAHV